ncbi:MAG TPA: hypothetical protein P5186_25635 [Candidatus Paceibacterota bacterium]|nr:hypothetical protein [Verrucomicrobiota bacterium]HRY51442.1 hypothetical protein [Candidatus Paceibacterota bacterium]
MVLDWSSRPTPDATGVLEITDQFLLFGVDADHRQAAPEELLLFFGNMVNDIYSSLGEK